MPAAKTFTCPDCGLQVSLSRNKAVISKKKSTKKQAIGRRLANRLPRDEKGRFLPAGSANRYQKKKRKRVATSSRSSKKGKETEEGPSEISDYSLFPDISLL